ncbi:MAG: transporter substrate-binding domain-containing protein [Thiohalomonadales bacterium]
MNVVISSTLRNLCLLILISVLPSCGDKKLPDSKNALSGELNIPVYTESGDLDAIRKRKQLRVLVPMFADQARYLPRAGLPLAYEQELILSYAATMDLVPIWVYVKEYGDLITRLNAGEGDMISGNMTATESRKQVVAFSLPIDIVKEQLVVAADAEIKSLTDMSGKSLAVQSSSSFWDTAQGLLKTMPDIHIETVIEGVSIQTIVDEVADGEYDATIVDSNLMSAILAYSDEVKPVLDVADHRVIAWAVRKDSLMLKASLDTFVQQQKLAESRPTRYTDDLPVIKQRKTLRVLTRNNTANYYLWRGRLMGFEYELVKEFSKKQGLRLEMIVVPARDQLKDWLLEGRGDLIAASMSIRPLNIVQSSLIFSDRYNSVNEVIVMRSDDKSIETLEDLQGRKIYVRQSSSYWNSLSKLKQTGLAFDLMAVPEIMETEEIIAKVADGSYDLTVSDSNLVEIELAWRTDIKASLIIRQGIQHGWLMRKNNPQLQAAVADFIKSTYRGAFYNITKTKYFKKKRRISKYVKMRNNKELRDQLSPYDEIVKRLSEKKALDWRLVVSQMFHESRFNPKARSWVGAQGLLQVMPRTAAEFGVTNLADPEQGILAGVRYLAWLRHRFEPELSVKDRMWFVLASYNAGLGHVRDARRLAKQRGLNPNIWFQNVEKAMLLLSKPKFSKLARFGYVRGSEPVKYVREVHDRYLAYLQFTES